MEDPPKISKRIVNLTDLNYIAYKQQRISKLLKKLETLKKQLRADFFGYADTHYQDHSHLLPMTSIMVPQKFFEITGMTHSDFLATRYPSWSNVSKTQKDDNIIFVLRKRQDYMPFSHTAEDVELARSVSEITPEIDWESMKAVDPELFKAFAEEVTSYKLNTETFHKFIENEKEFDAQGFLSRYTIHKPPTLRVLTKVVKDE